MGERRGLGTWGRTRCRTVGSSRRYTWGPVYRTLLLAVVVTSPQATASPSILVLWAAHRGGACTSSLHVHFHTHAVTESYPWPGCVARPADRVVLDRVCTCTHTPGVTHKHLTTQHKRSRMTQLSHSRASTPGPATDSHACTHTHQRTGRLLSPARIMARFTLPPLRFPADETRLSAVCYQFERIRFSPFNESNSKGTEKPAT